MSSSMVWEFYLQRKDGIIIFSCISFQSFKIHSLTKIGPMVIQHFPEKRHYNRLMNNNRDIVGHSFFDPSYQWPFLLPSQEEGLIVFAQPCSRERCYCCIFNHIGMVLWWINIVKNHLPHNGSSPTLETIGEMLAQLKLNYKLIMDCN